MQNECLRMTARPATRLEKWFDKDFATGVKVVAFRARVNNCETILSEILKAGRST
jgi:hypothetical protein